MKYYTTNPEQMGHIVKNRRVKWFGHVSRMDIGRIPNVSLIWTLIGKRKVDQKRPGNPQ